MRGVKLRGGCERWCVLPETSADHFEVRIYLGQRQKMFAGNASKLLRRDRAAGGRDQERASSGNYACVADRPTCRATTCSSPTRPATIVLHFDGTTWTTLNASQITRTRP